MSLRASPWWDVFLVELKSQPLSRLARAYGVPEAELLAALTEADPGGPAQLAPWWPELMRQRNTLPLRALARRFSTEPRRIRRALARLGLRTGGVELRGAGVPALAAFRERLGREPDTGIAREAGVAVEAVQGERARLRIPAFQAGAPVLLTPEEEAWILGPQKERRLRTRPDPEALQVVRRPARPEEPTRRIEADRSWDAARRGPQPGMALAPPPRPPRQPAFDPGPREEAEGGREVFHSRARELDQLLQPARPREGRQRIVRNETLRPAPPPEPAPVRPRPAVTKPEWRSAPVPRELIEPPPVRDVPVPPRAPPAVPRVVPVSSPPARPSASAVPAAPPRSVAPPPPPVSAPLPPVPAPAVVQPVVPSAPVPPEAARHAPLSTWHVRIPGEEAPMVLTAVDAWVAARMAAERLPQHLWPVVSVFRVDVDSERRAETSP